MEHHDASAKTQHNDTIETRFRRLTEAAGAVDQSAREAFAEVACTCVRDTVDTLVTLLRRARTVQP